MSDIVKRLNAAPVANHYYRPGDHINGTMLIERREAADEITRLRVENERLREALERITIITWGFTNKPDVEMREIARAALEGENT